VLVLTYSSITTFRNCHKRYYYSYDQCIKPDKKSWALTDGENVHYAMECYYTGEPVQDILLKLRSRYNENDEKEIYHSVLVHSLFEGYTLRHPANEFESYEPEVKFSIEVDNPNLPEKKFVLTGKTDGRIKQGGKPYLLETKTTSAYNIKDYLDRLTLDNQPDIYLYGFNRMGYSAVGMLYNVLVKPRLRQNSFEADDRFYKRIKKTILNDAKKDTPKYFHREMIYRSPKELADFEEELKQISEDMSQYYPYKNPSRCADWAGCEFKSLCEGGDMTGFVQKSKPHEEL